MNNTNTSRGMTAYLIMFMAIFSVTFYQVLQKEISPGVNPLSSLTITYLVALIMSVLLLVLFPGEGAFLKSFSKANYASYLLGIIIVGIELGFLLIYRTGWKIGVANIFSASVSAVFLILIGIVIYREHLSFSKIAGIVLCIAGLILISRK